MESMISTDRLILRHVNIGDVEAIQRCILDPRVYKMVARIPANQKKKATEDWILTHSEGRAASTDYVYAITLEQKLIGLIGLHRTSISEPFEIGFWMSPDAWNKGYITEAGKALLSCLEDKMGAQKTIGGYFADNPASGRVLKKLGYVQTDTGVLHCAGRNKILPYIIVERGTAT